MGHWTIASDTLCIESVALSMRLYDVAESQMQVSASANSVIKVRVTQYKIQRLDQGGKSSLTTTLQRRSCVGTSLWCSLHPCMSMSTLPR
jgi:hypothetical protein